LDNPEDGVTQSFDAESESLSDLRANDNQLYEALTLLRGVNLLASTGTQTNNASNPEVEIEKEEITAPIQDDPSADDGSDD